MHGIKLWIRPKKTRNGSVSESQHLKRVEHETDAKLKAQRRPGAPELRRRRVAGPGFLHATRSRSAALQRQVKLQQRVLAAKAGLRAASCDRAGGPSRSPALTIGRGGNDLDTDLDTNLGTDLDTAALGWPRLPVPSLGRARRGCPVPSLGWARLGFKSQGCWTPCV